jgi:predicted nucleic acid-binding Zn ribbon protein
MERAGRLIAKLQARAGWSCQELAAAAWPAAVGRTLASRTRVIHMGGATMLVEVEDDLWQRNLQGLRQQILANLASLLGAGVVNELEFRLRIPRRPAGRALPADAPAAPSFARGKAGA